MGGNPFKPIIEIGEKIIGGIGKIFGGIVSAITSPFGFNMEVPDFNMDIPDQESALQGVLLNKDSAVSKIPIVYGQRTVGGTRVLVSTNGDTNQYLYVAIVISEGQINSLENLTIDDQAVGLTSYAHGVVADADSSSKFKDRLKVQFFDGRDDQVSSSLLQEAPGWGSDHRLRGLAYLALRYEWKEIKTQDDQKNNPYTGGVPIVKAEIKGKKIFDVTTVGADSTAEHTTAYNSDTLVYSNNPVSIITDYLRSPRYGKGLSNTNIHWPSFKTAADLCDQTVTYTASSTGKAFTCNAVVDTSNTLLSNTKILLANFRGIMPYQQGKFRLKIEHGGDDTDISATPASPATAFAITNDHIIGGVQLEGETKSAKINRCIITYADPTVQYQPNEVVFPEEGSATDTAFLAEDNSVRLEKKIVMATITSREQALQFAEVFVRRSRTSKYVSMQTNLAPANVSVGDLIQVTDAFIGLDGVFRVAEMRINSAGTLEFGAIEHQAGNYAINEKGVDINRPVINLPKPGDEIQGPTALTYTPNKIYIG